ncbi:hypothetical protein J2X46_002929 [Nocardioides sp. BE266]|uniref:hypothetical protein n=1 Tax=Nocardioides sp. BE266 TaxID=2817725 RepID=UPI00285BFC05|nr:hypothetical protein [Nocardioides sp. BE266]MDR7253939.1 hypothetical protein [Nocardioides sp. BE266]
MTSEQMWLGAAGALALVALLVAFRAHRRATRVERLAESLAQRIDVLESPVSEAPRPVRDDEVSTFVITHLGSDQPREAVPVAQDIDGRLFADIVARETVVKAASWTAGLRRALSPESRNRIRFEVRQETRRAGRERRAEMKQALREFRERERADVARDLGEDVA